MKETNNTQKGIFFRKTKTNVCGTLEEATPRESLIQLKIIKNKFMKSL